MKQNITIEQLEELNNDQLKELYHLTGNPFIFRLAYQKAYDFKVDIHCRPEAISRITIGVMIEILESKTYYTQQIINEGGMYCITVNIKGCYATGWETDYYNELCDALWEAVVHVI